MVNRYRIEVRHPEQEGTDVEVIAADEADALAQAQAAAPAGSTLHRIVPLEIDYVAPEEPVEPTGTTASSMAAGMASNRASGVTNEPELHEEAHEPTRAEARAARVEAKAERDDARRR
jgi:hypothetical protein